MDISILPLSIYTSLATTLPIAGMRYGNTLSNDDWIQKLIEDFAFDYHQIKNDMHPMQVYCELVKFEAKEKLIRWYWIVDSVQGKALIEYMGNYDIDNYLLHLLLISGCDPNMKVVDVSPLQLAIHLKNYDLVILLLKYGADPYLKNSQGFDAFDSAEQVADPMIIEYLSLVEQAEFRADNNE